jgi:hypothetical protein
LFSFQSRWSFIKYMFCQMSRLDCATFKGRSRPGGSLVSPAASPPHGRCDAERGRPRSDRCERRNSTVDAENASRTPDCCGDGCRRVVAGHVAVVIVQVSSALLGTAAVSDALAHDERIDGQAGEQGPLARGQRRGRGGHSRQQQHSTGIKQNHSLAMFIWFNQLSFNHDLTLCILFNHTLKLQK